MPSFYTLNHAISYFLHSKGETSGCGVCDNIDTVMQTVKVNKDFRLDVFGK